MRLLRNSLRRKSCHPLLYEPFGANHRLNTIVVDASFGMSQIDSPSLKMMVSVSNSRIVMARAWNFNVSALPIVLRDCDGDFCPWSLAVDATVDDREAFQELPAIIDYCTTFGQRVEQARCLIVEVASNVVDLPDAECDVIGRVFAVGIDKAFGFCAEEWSAGSSGELRCELRHHFGLGFTRDCIRDDAHRVTLSDGDVAVLFAVDDADIFEREQGFHFVRSSNI